MATKGLPASKDSPVPAQPLKPDERDLPDHIRSFLVRAQSHWLKNTEVLSILQDYAKCGLTVSSEPPVKPPGGSIFLFDRKAVRFFRKDGHNWRKKADGKTVRETHEKLKVGNAEMLNCYYAHSERDDGPQRRCYWQLDSEDDIVLVHYLVVDKTRVGNGDILGSVPSDGRAASLARLNSQDEAVDELPDLDIGADMAGPDMLPTMSMDSFMAAIDEQEDTLQQRMKLEQADAFADNFLPSWEELAPSSTGNPADGPLHIHDGRQWTGGIGDRQEIAAPLPAHVVHAGGSLRLIEPLDPGYQAAPAEAWEGQGLNVLGTRQIPHDARQQLRRGASFARNGARMQAQEAMYATKQEQIQKAAEAVQTAQAALQGVAGSMATMQPPPAAQQSPYGYRQLQQPQPQPQLQRRSVEGRVPQSPTGRRPSIHGQRSHGDDLGVAHESDMYPGSRQPGPQDTAFPPIPETHSIRGAQHAIRPSPFGGQVQHGPIQRGPAVGHIASAQPGEISPVAVQTDSPRGFGRGRGGRLGVRSISMELPPMARTHSRGVTWRDTQPPGADVSQDIGGSKARGGAYAAAQAQALESELNRTMLHLRQPSGPLHPELVEEQVLAFDEHLLQLETASSQLLKHKSGPLPLLPDDLLTDGPDAPEPAGTQDNVSSSVPGNSAEDVMGDVGSAPLPFDILDYTPDWDFTTGGAKLILTCTYIEQTNLGVSDAHLYIMFDKQQVLAHVLRPGVIRVHVPPHDAGPVDLRLTFGDGRPRSCSLPFTYRTMPRSVRGSENSLVHSSDREMQFRLINMLTGASSQQSSDQDSAGYSSGSGRLPVSGLANGHASVDSRGGTSNLSTLSFQQAERLLTVMIERKVQAYISEVAARSPASAAGVLGTQAASLSGLHEEGYAVVHLLAGLGCSRVLDVLLAAGADPSLQDAWGYSPLHWAATKGHAEATAVLVARRSNVEATTFLGEAQPRLTPADAAAAAGHAGLAAFLGDAQLAHGALNLAARDRGTAAARPVPLQRKRSRHLPEQTEGEIDPPLIDVAMADATAAANNLDPAPGKENLLDPSAVVSRAKQNAQILEDAMLRKSARKAARLEKKLRLQKLQSEAMARLQHGYEWRIPAHVASGPVHQQARWRAWQLRMQSRVDRIRVALEAVIKAHFLALERREVDLQPANVADYGSDSDVAMSRSESFSSRRKLRLMHDSRRPGGHCQLARIADQDVRSILKSGAGDGMEADRSYSRSTFMRALKHVERLLEDEKVQAQYLELRGLYKAAEAAPQVAGAYKFARTTDALGA